MKGEDLPRLAIANSIFLPVTIWFLFERAPEGMYCDIYETSG